jgi:hypothetical protein
MVPVAAEKQMFINLQNKNKKSSSYIWSFFYKRDRLIPSTKHSLSMLNIFSRRHPKLLGKVSAKMRL